jgi:hypothetical protein
MSLITDPGDPPVMPRVTNRHIEQLPFAELNIVGDIMAGYGTTSMSAVGLGLLAYELSRVDSSIGTFFACMWGWRCSRSTCLA